MQVTRLSLAPQPEIDGIATDIEELSDFGLLATVELDRLNHFATKIVTVGFGHLNFRIDDYIT
jgi:hypothetical protein